MLLSRETSIVFTFVWYVYGLYGIDATDNDLSILPPIIFTNIQFSYGLYQIPIHYLTIICILM